MSSKLMLLFLLLAILTTITFAQEGSESPWTYVCRDKFCSKIWREDVGPDEIETTVEVCKLNCGEFGSLWPKPTGRVELGKEVITFESITFDVVTNVPVNLRPWMDEAESIFKSYMNMMNGTSSESVHNVNAAQVVVTFNITSPTKHLGLSTDESYELDIEETVNVKISAPTYFGARHALETLSQLIAFDESHEEYVIVETASVKDKPIYPYRGLMMDTSRNFISLPKLKRIIDGLSYNKLNIFHWHITDSHSFPMQVTNQPNLTLYGAYNQDKVYTVAEMKELVSYAKVRGVKIVAEFDQPAHVGNGWLWGKDGEDLAVCVNKDFWHQWCVQPPCGQFNIANERIYDILGDIYESMFDIFDHDIFHMGGDEVDMRCYNSTPVITDWMADKGWARDEAGFMKLWNDFQTKSYQKLVEANSEPDDLLTILWTSELTSEHYIKEYIDEKKYAVQIWSNADDEDEKKIIPYLINNKYRVIFSNVNAWYLDCGFHNHVLDTGYVWCSPYKTWQQVYENSPFKMYAAATNETHAENAIRDGLILGGIAPLWSEQIDEDAMEGRLWPRGSALAERLWTDPRTTGVREATIRMVNNRQRYAQRGILADRLQPEWCYQNENKCIFEELTGPSDPTMMPTTPEVDPPTTTSKMDPTTTPKDTASTTPDGDGTDGGSLVQVTLVAFLIEIFVLVL